MVFIAVDDLRPELGCYGSPVAVSPNLDALAARGRLFRRAYCQQAICRPSRASLMTGTRPETSGLIHHGLAMRDVLPDVVTLPQHFIAHGYEAAFAGKIFHHGDEDRANSWSRDSVQRPGGVERPKGQFALPENRRRQRETRAAMVAKYGDAAKQGLASGPVSEAADVPDHSYDDGYQTLRAIATLREMAAEPDRPFFLALGLKKPHLNWIAPKKYWDLYDPADIPAAEFADAPSGGAAMGLHASFELRTRDGVPKTGDIDEDLARHLKHAYLACVSYADAQIGKLLAALDEEGLRENTIVVVWGDHGWHLGDLGVWGKATNYEVAARVPLIVSAPGMTRPGEATDALVELVDIYPTLCELAGLPLPGHLEGTSFAPLLSGPDRPWKTAAFTQFPNPALREWAALPLSPAMRETWFGPLIGEVEETIIEQQGDAWDRELFETYLMGHAMRTDRYRLIVWLDRRTPEADPLFVEMFDHTSDPGETTNVADERPEVVAELLKTFRAGWKAARP